MGLDNGVVLKHKLTKEESVGLRLEESFIDKDTTEICYWRKCWNVREIFIKCLHIKEDMGATPIEADDIPRIIRELSKLFSKDAWEEGDSIWEFEEIFPSLVDSVVNLEWLQRYLEAHPDKEAYFYDSY